MIEFVTGNILAADVEASVNPANAHGVMGAGLALQFKNKYPRMFAEYKRRCAAGEFGPGEVVPVKGCRLQPPVGPQLCNQGSLARPVQA